MADGEQERTPEGLPDHARVVIVGGGAIGASVAYHFAKLGWHVAIGRACRAGAKAMGLDLYSPDNEDRAREWWSSHQPTTDPNEHVFNWPRS